MSAPRHRCLRCGRRGTVRVYAGHFGRYVYFCGVACLNAYRVANLNRTVTRA